MILRKIGFWKSDDDPSLPDPRKFVDKSMTDLEKASVWHYLVSGTMHSAVMGTADCRICGEDNGALEFTDGTLLWPEGLAHYVLKHSVRLPLAILDHINTRAKELDGALQTLDWWREVTNSRPSSL